jgi:hypothetical protein
MSSLKKFHSPTVTVPLNFHGEPGEKFQIVTGSSAEAK